MGMIEKTYHNQNLTYRNSWFQIIRPLTYTATLSPAIGGTALASTKGPVRIDLMIYVLVVGLFVQSAVNMLNDYYDYQKGQDQEKWASSQKLVQPIIMYQL